MKALRLLLPVLMALGLVSCAPVRLIPAVKNETSGPLLFTYYGGTLCVAPGELACFSYPSTEVRDDFCIVNARADKLSHPPCSWNFSWVKRSLLEIKYYQVLRVCEDAEGKIFIPEPENPVH